MNLLAFDRIMTLKAFRDLGILQNFLLLNSHCFAEHFDGSGLDILPDGNTPEEWSGQDLSLTFS
jgi:hypothetical protein